jgi:hypothetical protein
MPRDSSSDRRITSASGCSAPGVSSDEQRRDQVGWSHHFGSVRTGLYCFADWVPTLRAAGTCPRDAWLGRPWLSSHLLRSGVMGPAPGYSTSEWGAALDPPSAD